MTWACKKVLFLFLQKFYNNLCSEKLLKRFKLTLIAWWLFVQKSAHNWPKRGPRAGLLKNANLSLSNLSVQKSVVVRGEQTKCIFKWALNF